MSICNVHCDADRMLLAVDTAVATQIKGKHGPLRKAQKGMIHGTTVVAGRGPMGVLYHLYAELMEAFRFWDIDTLRSELEPMLKRAHTRTLRDWGMSGKTAGDALKDCEITIGGWSEQKKQMRAFVATLQPGGEWVIELIAGRCIAPGAPSAVDDDVSTEQTMMAAARKQVAHFADDPDAIIGGQLIAYEIRPGGIIVRQSGAI